MVHLGVQWSLDENTAAIVLDGEIVSTSELIQSMSCNIGTNLHLGGVSSSENGAGDILIRLVYFADKLLDAGELSRVNDFFYQNQKGDMMPLSV